MCRFALLLAKAANLSEEAIQDLGVTAMFHDMGYAAREGADPDKGEEGFRRRLNDTRVRVRAYC